MGGKMTRRQFTKASTAAALGLAAASQTARGGPAGANDRVRLGFIGVGNRGGQLLDAFLAHSDMEVVALCDVYEPYLQRAQGKVSAGAATYKDFRKMLERKDLDGVVIATPDHWHAIQTIMACESGRDVYVEKPLSITIHEGRKMVEAARKHDRIVQVGTHRRSSLAYMELAKRVQRGDIGKVTIARAYRASNMYPDGIGHADPGEPLTGLDWDMWLGPRDERKFRETMAPYKFRWWKKYSSQVANWGVHYFDAIRWVLGDVAPASVSCHGGVYAVDDDRTIPDTLEATFEMPAGRLVIFGQYEASSNRVLINGECEYRGTQGTVYSRDDRFEIIPEKGGQFQSSESRMEYAEYNPEQGDLTEANARNFLDCVKSRKRPNADVEEGHRSTTFALLANIALETRARLDWDGEREVITNNREANDLLHYEYRKPWSLPS